ncbi:MAG: selenium cofactor biosynthesis protein YqeC [Sedimentibacter sp.]
MKTLTEIFNIKKGDVVSIVGSGGKTSLLFMLAEELKNECRLLVSTSAKILKPAENDYDHLYLNINTYLSKRKENSSGITVVSKDIDDTKRKLLGIDDNDLDLLIPDFDIILLEADGSKGMPLKGWKNHEPPVLNKTTKTIGVMPVNLINKKINKEFIYGFDEFNILTGNSEYINFEAIGKICSHKDGIFKNSTGSLYLFLNKSDTEEEIAAATELSKYLNEFIINESLKFKICYGSLKKGVYYEC